MWLIRKVSLKDSDLLFKWRNSPEVFKFLFNPMPIERANHDTWIEKTIANNLIAFYIISLDGNDIGTVRFDFEAGLEKAEVGIYLAPDQHGKGLGALMLNQAELKAKSEFPNLKYIIAKVVPDNIASEKMFLKANYNKKFIQLEKKYE